MFYSKHLGSGCLKSADLETTEAKFCRGLQKLEATEAGGYISWDATGLALGDLHLGEHASEAGGHMMLRRLEATEAGGYRARATRFGSGHALTCR